jgi:hypothetical protein
MAEERPALDIMAGVRELLADTEPLPGDPQQANPLGSIPAGAWISFDIGPGGIAAFTQFLAPKDPEAEKAARKQRRIDKYAAVKASHGAGSMAELIAGFCGTQAQVDDMRDRRIVTDWEYRARIVPAVGMAYAEMLREARYLAGQMDDCVACGCDDCILRDLDQFGLRLDDTLAAIQSLSKWLISRQ